jgi:hypothetical protein
MHVEVGPVSAASALAWLDYARTLVDGGRIKGRRVDAGIPGEVAESFGRYLDSWQLIADKGGDFKWVDEVDPEEAEYLVLAFYRAAQRMNELAVARGRTIMPPEAALFYACLVNGLLDALASEGKSTAGFAEELRGFWPGFE